jgi:hypothetical protein
MPEKNSRFYTEEEVRQMASGVMNMEQAAAYAQAVAGQPFIEAQPRPEMSLSQVMIAVTRGAEHKRELDWRTQERATIARWAIRQARLNRPIGLE